VLPADDRVRVPDLRVHLELAERHDRQRVELELYSVWPGVLQRRDAKLHVQPVQQQQQPAAAAAIATTATTTGAAAVILCVQGPNEAVRDVPDPFG